MILNTIKQLNLEYSKRQSQLPVSAPSYASVAKSSSSINRYPVHYGVNSSVEFPGRQSLDQNASAVALLLGTTVDSPLLGTLFGASSVSPSLNSSNSNSSLNSAILACRRLKVSFRDEPGEGSGVARSFFTAFAEAVLAPIVLPSLTNLLQLSMSNSATCKFYLLSLLFYEF